MSEYAYSIRHHDNYNNTSWILIIKLCHTDIVPAGNINFQVQYQYEYYNILIYNINNNILLLLLSNYALVIHYYSIVLPALKFATTK